MTPAEKTEAYRAVAADIAAVLDGEPDLTARMATVACLLHQAFDHYFWTGFYVVDPAKTRELVIGPYQGTLGCLRISFERGVCGAAARTGETQLVPDVHAFPGHIACDSHSQSEVVVPVFDGRGALIAVLDVDSDRLAAFDEIDARALEAICRSTFAA